MAGIHWMNIQTRYPGQSELRSEGVLVREIFTKTVVAEKLYRIRPKLE